MGEANDPKWLTTEIRMRMPTNMRNHDKKDVNGRSAEECLDEVGSLVVLSRAACPCVCVCV